MKERASLATLLCLALGLGSAARAETPALKPAAKGAAMATRASGTFEVQVKPLPGDEKVEGLSVGRLSLAKQFKGDLEGTSKGEMTTTGTTVQGSAGYVAIERVSGSLGGRSGSFVLLHQGTMKSGGDFKLSIVVVPDSGTEGVTGLAGSMAIIIADGKHSYEFDHTLPDTP